MLAYNKNHQKIGGFLFYSLLLLKLVFYGKNNFIPTFNNLLYCIPLMVGDISPYSMDLFQFIWIQCASLECRISELVFS